MVRSTIVPTSHPQIPERFLRWGRLTVGLAMSLVVVANAHTTRFDGVFNVPPTWMASMWALVLMGAAWSAWLDPLSDEAWWLNVAAVPISVLLGVARALHIGFVGHDWGVGWLWIGFTIAVAWLHLSRVWRP